MNCLSVRYEIRPGFRVGNVRTNLLSGRVLYNRDDEVDSAMKGRISLPLAVRTQT